MPDMHSLWFALVFCVVLWVSGHRDRRAAGRFLLAGGETRQTWSYGLAVVASLIWLGIHWNRFVAQTPTLPEWVGLLVIPVYWLTRLFRNRKLWICENGILAQGTFWP